MYYNNYKLKTQCPNIRGSKICWFSGLVQFTTEVFMVTLTGDVVFNSAWLFDFGLFLGGEAHTPVRMVGKDDPRLLKSATRVY